MPARLKHRTVMSLTAILCSRDVSHAMQQCEMHIPANADLLYPVAHMLRSLTQKRLCFCTCRQFGQCENQHRSLRGARQVCTSPQQKGSS
jgi:hypothetical protein